MGSLISAILSAYKTSLDTSRERYENEIDKRLTTTKEFYDEFLKNLIIVYDPLRSNNNRLDIIGNLVRSFFGSDEVKFAAVDGTSYKEEFQDYMVFFGAAYAIRGSISFGIGYPSTKYERWSTEQDVSMVAYIPVPFAELGALSEEQFVIESDVSNISLNNIHTQLMQLAEVFLLYDLVSSSSLRPRFVLWDQSISGVLANTTVNVESISLKNVIYNGRKIGVPDFILAYSRPYNDELEIPSKKDYKMYDRIIKEVIKSKKISTDNLANILGISKERVFKEIETNLMQKYILKSDINPDGLLIIDKTDGVIKLNEQSPYIGSWDYIKSYFVTICTRLFKDKDVKALLYEREINGEKRETWMTPSDLKFLIAVGIRALIEICWKHKVMFVGIVKDSSSSYFTKNYLGITKKFNIYSFNEKPLLWTDRTVLEAIPYFDENIKSPWSTIEFDSVFMTLAMRKETPDSIPKPQGVKGNVLNTERLIARSLAQFYLNRDKPTILAGHVIFIDRLLFPELDKQSIGEFTIPRIVDDIPSQIGEVSPILYRDKNELNKGQQIIMYILEILTRNLYPEVIGYPDPLHKADWGAKNLNKKVKGMIKTSGKQFISKPLNLSLRGNRNNYRRI
ncbi:MAG: hypothetical protein ACP5L0_07455 [Caldisphaera sp.]|uniref:hypothetical protein n=1 Tax=Caldisphaera sp. TaxID=2060322 RepID=UPI003D14FA84